MAYIGIYLSIDITMRTSHKVAKITEYKFKVTTY